MKRILCVFLLLCLLLSACGGKAPSAKTELTPAPTPEQTIPEATPTPNPTPTPTPTPEPTPTPVPTAEPLDHYLVDVREHIPGIAVELRYGGEDNFTGERIYAFSDAYLRLGTAQRLAEVQAELEEMGLGLKIWDAFRPVSAQFTLWEVCPNPAYVANPLTGFSSHSRGNTVDVTLVDSEGAELIMPTGFDDFSLLADRDYSDCSPEAAENARLLENVMARHGFSGYFAEWWHFTDSWGYEVEKVFDPALMEECFALCEEYISLRAEPSTSAETLCTIPAGESFVLMGFSGEFSYVDYLGIRGYVLTAYTG